jgi:hypothetical protein
VFVVFAVVLAVFWLIPAPKKDGELVGEGQERNGPGTDLTPLHQGGFPTPPMDLVVPPTPRSLAPARVTAGAPETPESEA